MNRLVIKKFVVGGLDLVFRQIPLEAGPGNRLSNVLEAMSRWESRLQFRLTPKFAASTIRHVRTISWTDVETNLRTDSQLGNRFLQRDDWRSQFKYTLINPYGFPVLSTTDDEHPIFSQDSPQVETGFTIRFDLVPPENDDANFILARKPFAKPPWYFNHPQVFDL